MPITKLGSLRSVAWERHGDGLGSKAELDVGCGVMVKDSIYEQMEYLVLLLNLAHAG